MDALAVQEGRKGGELLIIKKTQSQSQIEEVYRAQVALRNVRSRCGEDGAARKV
jgi:hypothetical protein